MQLSARHAALLAATLGLAMGVAARTARADAALTAGSSVFLERGGPLKMNVIVPTVDAEVDLGDAVGVSAGWTADVVSGASVAVVDAPAENVDAITSATLTDTRHQLTGGIELRDGRGALATSYHYSFENDYRSHAFDVSGRTEILDRNTAVEVTYARNFDRVCDGPPAPEAVQKQRLDSSDGCFGSADDRTEQDLSLQTFQGAWTQAWTPVLSMQLTATAQLVHGFQANPYRAVRIGRIAAQEHHPDDRARYAVGLGFRIWLEPLNGALQTYARAYRDTWDIRGATAELAYEQSVGAAVRIRGRGRYYTQTEAAFYSDDYVRQPRGQYFTGDRELSPMRSAMLGLQFSFDVPADDEGDVLGFMTELELVLKADLLKSWFDDFHYDQAEVPNDVAWLGTANLRAGF
jgi:hypothetical protein